MEGTSSRTNSYTVVYNANGGNGTMKNSTHIIGEDKNLSANTFTRDNYNFMGWAVFSTGPAVYTDEENVTDLIMAGNTVILYAAWRSTNIVPGSDLFGKLAWLQVNAQDGTDYILEVNTSQNINPVDLSYNGKRIGITLIGMGNGYVVINLTSKGSLFTVGDGVTLVLDDNVVLWGFNKTEDSSGNNESIVRINNGGTLILNSGKISFNEGNFWGGVYVFRGTFIMNGGEISGNNTSSDGGGVNVFRGTFIMNDGTISDNQTQSVFRSTYGGGVFIGDYSIFTMNGGTISGNTATCGGGVSIDDNSTFIITNGTIYGSDVYIFLANTSRYGAALYGTAEYGTFNGGTWKSKGRLDTINDTIQVVNGKLLK